MAGLGERLKQEREMRGVSLEEIAAATRIHKKFLQALEDNNFDALPAPVFVTGFLRSYASHLGLDPNELVAEYDAVKKPAAPIQPIMTNEPLPYIDKEKLNRNLPTILGGLGAMLVVVLLAVFIIRSGGSQDGANLPKPEEEELLVPAAPPAPSDQAPAEGVPAADGAAPSTVAAAQTATPAVPLTAAEVKPGAVNGKTAAVAPTAVKPAPQTPPAKAAAAPAPAAKPAEKPYTAEESAAKKYSLSMTAEEQDVWVYVLVDGSDVRDMYVRAGQTVFLKGAETFVLTTGNAYYLKLKVNGKPVTIPSSGANKVIRNWSVPLPE